MSDNSRKPESRRPEENGQPLTGRGDLQERLEQFRLQLRRHHAGVEPDAGFAGRVMARLDRPAAELLGWAATKLLPATLALVLVLAWFALKTTPQNGSSPQASPTDEPLAWILNEGEATP
jgi:hypothetical protein